MTTFHCRIVTPADSVLDTEVTYASFQSFDGQQGVMRGASPFLAKLGRGACRVETASGSTQYVLSGGFAQMNHNTLILLADSAELASTIDPEAAQKQVHDADAKISATGSTPRTLAEGEAIEHEQSLARARLAASRRR